MSDRIFHERLALSAENEIFFERPRINEIFANALQKPLVVVSAGVGYGKTPAVYSFLQNYSATAI